MGYWFPVFEDKKGGNTTNVQINVENMNYKEVQEKLGIIDKGIEHLMTPQKEAHNTEET